MTRIVGIGDSWMARYSDTLRADADPLGLLGLLDPARFFPVNLAVSGSTAEQWANNFGSRLAQAMALFDECDCYAVSLGGNDARTYIDAHSDGGATITQTERERGVGSLIGVLSKLRATGKRVIVMQYSNPYPSDLATACGVDILNMGIRHAARRAGIKDADMICSATVLSAPGMMSGLGIHPKDPDGYAALAKLIEGMFP